MIGWSSDADPIVIHAIAPNRITIRSRPRSSAGRLQAGVKLMYAEELLFAPKYVRAKQLVEEGALGEVYLVKQGECHYGPHADWFWDVDRSGGGVLMDIRHDR